MGVDLSQFSTEDLQALKARDISKVSTDGLMKLKQAQPTEPSTARVALQSAAKGAAAIPDMFLNLPSQVANLASAGVGYAAGELGRPDITAKMPILQAPSPVRSGLEAMGAIRPEFEPQTAGQRILGRAMETAPMFAMAPGKTLANVATGALSGLTAGATKELTGSELAAQAVGFATPFAVRGAVAGGQSILEPVRKETLKEAAAAGYVVPPSVVKPTGTTKRLESVAGKASLSQEASMRNQQVTNKLAAKSIGLPENTPLTADALKTVREKAGQVYNEVDQLRATQEMPWFPRFHVTDLGEQLKQARNSAHSWYMANKAKPNPTYVKRAEQFDALADSLEKDIQRIAEATGKPDLVARLAEARTLYARARDIERALIPGTGDVSASKIGDLLKRHHLGGELEVIGKFAKAFPRESRNAVSVPSPGVSGTDTALGAVMGELGYGVTKNPVGLLAAGLPLLRGPARSAALSAPVQSRLLREPEAFKDVLLKGALAAQER